MMNLVHAVPDKVAVALERGDSPTMVFRLAAGMSTTAFASLTGLPVDRIEEIEAGQSVTVYEAVHMGRVLGIPDELLATSSGAGR